MSVLKSRRGESKAEFVNTARKIKVETRSFLARLSARYARLDAPDIMRLARDVADRTEMANSTVPADQTRYEFRKQHLLQARASLSALDSELLDVYETLMLNPEGSFATRKGQPLRKDEAIRRLDYMAENLGSLIAAEERLLGAVIKSDMENFRKRQK